MADANYDTILEQAAAETTLIDSVIVYTDGLEQQVADALSGVTIPPAVQEKLNAIFNFGEQHKAQLEKALLAGVNP